ncbi:hypothetical protein BDW74DRAFT_55889 [Aspergillus multicolor]|uniref:putative GPI-anchored cell wall protein Pst1 n=1 Tax=Aspergillus multicolor TaxID=41759 RepID=UPI003CCE3FF7
MIPILIVLYALAGLTPVSAQSCSSVTITSQSSADTAFSSCKSISGSVTISPSASGTLNLENLERISENLVIESTSLVGIIIPDLEDVGGSVSVTDNDQLNRLSLGSLSTIDGDLNVQGNNALVDLSLDDLETVRGGVHLSGGFNTLSFEKLETVGGNSSVVATGSAGCSGIEALDAEGEEEAEGRVFQGGVSCATTTVSTSTSTSTATSTSTSTSTSTLTSTTTPTASDEAASTDSNSVDSGLSGGAIAGIVVGVVVGVIIILVLIWLFLRERRKNRANAVTAAAVGGAGASGAAAIGIKGPDNDEEKQPSQDTSISPTEDTAPALAAAGGAAAGAGGAKGSIPRRPVSTSTAFTLPSPTSTDRASSTLPSSLTAGTSNPISMPVPTALIPGTNGPPASGPPGARRGDGDGDALFFTTAPVAGRPPPRPQRQPSESDVPMLDSENVHEVSGVAVPRSPERSERVIGEGAVFELDGGFEGARHQRAIHGEPEGDSHT